MPSATFERIRLFTDIEDITLDEWLRAEDDGEDELAAEILDAGLLVEHMIATIPLQQDLADNSELDQLIENANKVFGLIVCFGCNRAFANKQEQQKKCPNCGSDLTKEQLTGPNVTEEMKNEPVMKPKTPKEKFEETKKHHEPRRETEDEEDESNY